MNKEQYETFEDILDAIMLQEAEPSHQALMRWAARYPEHRDELARFFATWAVQKDEPKEATVDEARVGHRLVSHALNILHRQEAARVRTESAVAERLSDAITSRGVSEEGFAACCGLDASIVAKLDRRLIRIASIPRKCLERIAAALHCGIEAVRSMLAGDPISLQSYKARGRPAIKVEDFLDAVRASDLSEEAKAEWIQIVAAEAATGGTV